MPSPMDAAQRGKQGTKDDDDDLDVLESLLVNLAELRAVHAGLVRLLQQDDGDAIVVAAIAVVRSASEQVASKCKAVQVLCEQKLL